MGLFDKKYCDICGSKIGLLGNRKLEDGNLCKDCAKKLSPWFSERRHSTKASIQEQLNYREANREAVAAFHTTRSLGKNTKLLLDEDNRKRSGLQPGHRMRPGDRREPLRKEAHRQGRQAGELCAAPV